MSGGAGILVCRLCRRLSADRNVCPTTSGKKKQRPKVAGVEVFGDVAGNHVGMLLERGGETAAHLGRHLVADVQELTKMRVVSLAGGIVAQ